MIHMTSTQITSADEIFKGVAAYNAEWLETEGTNEDKATFMKVLADGVPTLTVSLDPIKNGHTYKAAATFGLMFDGGFYAAEDPQVRTLRMFDGRLSPFHCAKKAYKAPAGVELRMLRHGVAGHHTVETVPAA